MLENLPMFRAKRGRITFTCEDVASGRIWRHQSNYDIYYSENSFLFLHVDPASHNVLTLGLRRESVSPSLMAYALLFVRYEIAPEEPQTPLLQLPGDGTPLLLRGGPGFAPPSPLMSAAAPFFVQNDGSPVVQVFPVFDERLRLIMNIIKKNRFFKYSSGVSINFTLGFFTFHIF